MINFHGFHKTHSYFEGWYLKHESTSGDMISFIPAFHIDESGNKTASIQIITQNASYNKTYKISEFKVNKNKFYCKIGNNIFTAKGIIIDIQVDNFSVKGKLLYDDFLPLKSDIMGPFRFLPFMQCNHGVLSLSHRLKGKLKINQKDIDFTDGVGYLEKDWGNSFPPSYLWSQCNWSENGDYCIMTSVADVPFLNRQFLGCICSVYYQQKEYRLATYYGAKILDYSERGAVIKQGKYCLEIGLIDNSGCLLQAPVNGNMSRQVIESLVCNVRYRFWESGNLIFDITRSNVSFEYAGQ